MLFGRVSSAVLVKPIVRVVGTTDVAFRVELFGNHEDHVDTIDETEANEAIIAALSHKCGK